jgi:CheY-like chemotaxis protein
MEAVGRLAAGIAHDFNNHLAVVLGFTEMLQERLRADSVSQDRLAQVHGATLRAASLTKQLLAFSRQQVLQPVVLDLNASVDELEKMLRRVIGENIEVVFKPSADLKRIHADPTQIDQILMNLVINARDAMPEGGRLTIETANVELDAEYAATHITSKPGPYVMLAISDNGSGMDAATQARIFEPFFTTKESGKGTGLGLCTVYGIVKQSGGSVWFYSEVGRGTAFKIYFPAILEAVTVRPVEIAFTPAAVRGETILIVEDQPPLLEVMREMLQQVGYTVHPFTSPLDALRNAEEDPTSPALLITDLIMPEMSGRELSQRIKALHPETKVMYMSGYTDDTVLRLGIHDSGWSFMQKPFNRNDLMQKVRASLDSAS